MSFTVIENHSCLLAGEPYSDGTMNYCMMSGYTWYNAKAADPRLGYVCEVSAMVNDHRKECPVGTVTGLVDVCYQFDPVPRNYPFAVLVCGQNGGTLVSIHDQRTNDLIANAIVGMGFEWIHLGAELQSAPVYDGKWKWSDGTPFDYTNWTASTSAILAFFAYNDPILSSCYTV